MVVYNPNLTTYKSTNIFLIHENIHDINLVAFLMCKMFLGIAVILYIYP